MLGSSHGRVDPHDADGGTPSSFLLARPGTARARVAWQKAPPVSLSASGGPCVETRNMAGKMFSSEPLVSACLSNGRVCRSRLGSWSLPSMPHPIRSWRMSTWATSCFVSRARSRRRRGKWPILGLISVASAVRSEIATLLGLSIGIIKTEVEPAIEWVI